VTGSGAGFRQAGIDHVDLGADQVHLPDGTTFLGLDAFSNKRHEHIKVASCDPFGPGKDDLIDQVTGIITVGEFYACAAGARSSSPERAASGGGLLS
jgi:hypothetical protein